MKDKALVLLSGGQDSTTCLYWTLQKYNTVETLFFHYEQRHHLEFEFVIGHLPREPTAKDTPHRAFQEFRRCFYQASNRESWRGGVSHRVSWCVLPLLCSSSITTVLYPQLPTDIGAFLLRILQIHQEDIYFPSRKYPAAFRREAQKSPCFC